jgi:hypothetical protein
MWLFFQPADERARPWQSYVKVIDPEEQEKAVARFGVVGTCQRGMLVGAPLVETEIEWVVLPPAEKRPTRKEVLKLMEFEERLRTH